jgi:hypothetical protein
VSITKASAVEVVGQQRSVQLGACGVDGLAAVTGLGVQQKELDVLAGKGRLDLGKRGDGALRGRIADRCGDDHDGRLMGVVVERVADALLVRQREVLGDGACHRFRRGGMSGQGQRQAGDCDSP